LKHIFNNEDLGAEIVVLAGFKIVRLGEDTGGYECDRVKADHSIDK